MLRVGGSNVVEWYMMIYVCINSKASQRDDTEEDEDDYENDDGGGGGDDSQGATELPAGTFTSLSWST